MRIVTPSLVNSSVLRPSWEVEVEDGNKGMGPKSMPRKLKLKSSSVSCDPKAIVPGADVTEETVEVEVMAAAALDREATGEVVLKAAGVTEEAGRVPVKAVATWEREVAGEAADVEVLGAWKVYAGALGVWEVYAGVLGTWEVDAEALGTWKADTGGWVPGKWMWGHWAPGEQTLGCWAHREQMRGRWVHGERTRGCWVLGEWTWALAPPQSCSQGCWGSVALLFFACGPHGLSLSLRCLCFFTAPDLRSTSTSSTTSARWDLVNTTQWMAPLCS
ncbi:hypothetical protein DFH08DRAFT_813547 [Mycena albidolilacea]|uniref:Uncharacterized protein n=1 Tax=Mycena albidolilacea TaxID=1033008 RepID=A0AAD6ZRT2_9AGAR|nr:hypothetical protein DFH08DRAFT_813547 [Mycena albidolilacea]